MARQNKFTQSVLERLEQEAQLQKEKQKESRTAAEIPTEKPEEEPEPIKAEKSPALKAAKTKAQKRETVKEEPVIPDLSSILNQTPQRVAKNKTFYLDEEVIDTLKNTAKAQKTTDSRLCNDILRAVLGLDQ